MRNTVFVGAICLFLIACGGGSEVTSEPVLPEEQRYLAENAANERVVVTESGLQYEVLRTGTGTSPAADSVVTVHYVGTLIDGTEFDSSFRRNQPATFSLAQVIPGWTEGVQLMNVGSRYRFVIPPDLAYGNRGAGELIGPNEVLIFVVDLLEINAN